VVDSVGVLWMLGVLLILVCAGVRFFRDVMLGWGLSRVCGCQGGLVG